MHESGIDWVFHFHLLAVLIFAATVTAFVIINRRLKAAPESLAGELSEGEDERHEALKLNRFLNAIIDSTDVSISVTDLDGNVLVWNRAAEKITGYTREEIQNGDVFPKLYPDEDYRNMMREKRQDILAGVSVDIPYIRLRSKDGQEKIAPFHSRRIVDEEGNLTGIVNITLDMTEQTNAQHALEESEAQKQSILDGFPGMIVQTDLEGTVRWANKVVLDTMPEACGRKCHEIFMGQASPCERCVPISSEADGPIPSRILEVVDERGVPGLSFWENTGFPVKDTEGMTTGVICISRNVTNRITAERSMRDSEGKYRELFNRIMEPVFILDGETWRFVDCNEVAVDVYGYSRDELREMTPANLHPAEEAEWIESYLKRPDHDTEHIFTHETRSGERLDVLIRGQSTLYEGRQARLVIISDVTERKQAEVAIRESEEKFSRIFHTTPDAITVTRLSDGCLLDVNEGFTRIFGYSRAEAVGSNTSELRIWLPDDDHTRWAESLQRTEVIQGHEVTQRRKDGTNIVVLISARIIDISGEECIISIARDISDRKRAEESLARLAAVVQQTAEGVLMTDPEGIVQYANPAFEQMTGYSHKSLRGRAASTLEREVTEQDLMVGVSRAIAQGEVCEQTIGGETRDGAQIRVELAVSLIRDADDKITNYVAILRDVTRESDLENQLRQAQKMDAIGTLAGGIAHDFNNLLTAILGCANMLKEDAEEGTSVRDSAATIERAAERAAELTQQLLGFARRGKHQNVPVNMHETIGEVIQLLKRTFDRNIRIVQRFNTHLASVMGDPLQMQQIVLNLCVNARDAMPDGGELLFETSMVTLDEDYADRHVGAIPGTYLMTTVTDTGTGIEKEHINRIFEPLFTTKEQEKGTGMGLAMVYGIVKNHNGYIQVYTEVGVGTTFKVYLPPADDDVVEIAPVVVERSLIAGTGLILVVDDEEVVLEVATQMLKSLGYEVVTAANGREAVEYFTDHWQEVDLVIIDMIMPEMDGHGCIREMKRISPAVKSILSTGFGLNGRAQAILDEGVQGFVQKPYKLSELSTALDEVMGS
jgi:two-component system, cell cycle sensor histidine kinase and response regulator CckA